MRWWRRATSRAGLVAALASLPMGAQENGAPAAVFLEKASFSLLTPSGKNLLFEGQPTAHYFFFNQLNNAEWQMGNTRGVRRWRLAMPISELFVVRMTDTTSEPVLTPSYHIRPLYLQAVRIWRATPWDTRYWLLGLGTGATHYSNGQHGCTYLGYTRNVVTRECEVTTLALAARRIANTEDGDFSTTYLPLTAHLRRAQLIEKESSLKWQWTLGGEFQYHLFGGLPGAMNREQAVEYGRHQWSLSAELECRPARKTGVYRIATDVTRRLGGGAAHALTGGSVQISRIWDRVERFGVFGRYHYGFDYYNIRFQDTRPFVSVGFLWDIGRLDSLAFDAAPPTGESSAVAGCFNRFWKRVPLSP